MIAQKELFIPTVDTVPVTNFDASENFITDYIEFPNSTKDWSIQFILSTLETISSPKITLLVSNDLNGYFSPYKESSTNMLIAESFNQNVFDNIMPFRYMKISYLNNGYSGSEISIVITK